MQNSTDLNLVKELREIEPFQRPEFNKGTSLESLVAFFKSLSETEQSLLQTILFLPAAFSIRKIRRRLCITFYNKIPIYKDKENQTVMIKKIIKSSELEFEEIISDLNQRYSLNAPSYYKTKSLLKNFQKMGLAIKRKTEGNPAYSLWYVEPKLLKIWLAVVNELERKKKDKTMTDTERFLYFVLTGRVAEP